MNTRHPFMRQVLRVRIDELRQLLGNAMIDVNLFSPFRGLVTAADGGTKIITKAGARHSLDPTLRKLARPRARVRITTISAGVSASALDFFATGDTAYAVYLEGSDLHVSAGLPIGALAETIAEQLAVDVTCAATVQTYEAFCVRLATTLWFGTGMSHLHAIPMKRAIDALALPNLLAYRGLDCDAARHGLDRVIGLGCVRQIKGQLSLEPDFRYWMNLLWSGHFLEMLYGGVCNGPEHPAESFVRLTFAGPAASRFLMTTANATASAQYGTADSQKIQFRHLSHGDATHLIQQLLASAC